ncbi:hypothetical protein KKG31_02880 [Patescibacteria group bacterium]|nr:hypothetical protein [Patescibacteria group bacterium]MBU1758106.1 hypothetical protein [Patescibacteria group bacterium]
MASIQIDFNGEKYTADSQYLEWHGEYLTFYPKSWLPVDENLSLVISIADKQEYGGANVLKKEFEFQTAKGMLLQNNISPELYRKIIKRSENVFASDVECRMLKQAYAEIDSASQEILKGVLNKMACDTTDIPLFVQQYSSDTVQAASLLNN